MLRCPECGFEFVCRAPQAIVVDEEDSELVLTDELAAPSADADMLELTDEASPLEAIAGQVADAEQALAAMPTPKPPVIRENPRQWHVIVAGVPAVAMTYQQLKGQAAEGTIKPRTKLLYVPSDLTVAAGEVPGLFPDLDAKRAAEAHLAPATGPAAQESKALASALDSLSAESEDAAGGPQPPQPPRPPDPANESSLPDEPSPD